jgi:hypothetical protein
VHPGPDATPAHRAPAPPHVYRLEPYRYRLFLAVAAAIAAHAVVIPLALLWALSGAGIGREEVAVAVAPAILLLSVAGAIAVWARRIRLVVAPDAVELHGFGSVVISAWQNVEAIGTAGAGFLAGDGLLLRAPGRVDTPLLLRLLGVTPSGRSISLGAFALPFAGSALEADVLAHLPDDIEDRRRPPRVIEVPERWAYRARAADGPPHHRRDDPEGPTT